MGNNRMILVGALAVMLTWGGASAEAGVTVIAENGADLAAKILQANSDTQIEKIKCAEAGACDVTGTLPTYTGSQRLVINGKNSTIDASGITDTDAFAATGGGVLKLIRLNFVGGMSGIYVEVPADKGGNQRVELRRVVVRDAALHGVYVNDDAEAAAGVRLIIRASKFIGNGFAADDQDGVHVDESGKGQVFARIVGSRFIENGSDGLELAETKAGDVTLTVERSRFLDNGTNPTNPADPDDGLDIDEAGSGDLRLIAVNSRFNRNFDDGIDIDERGGGAIFGNLDNVTASKNLDQGFTGDERQFGDFFVTVIDSTITSNDENSRNIDIRARQSDQGNGSLTLQNVVFGRAQLTGVTLSTTP